MDAEALGLGYLAGDQPPGAFCVKAGRESRGIKSERAGKSFQLRAREPVPSRVKRIVVLLESALLFGTSRRHRRFHRARMDLQWKVAEHDTHLATVPAPKLMEGRLLAPAVRACVVTVLDDRDWRGIGTGGDGISVAGLRAVAAVFGLTASGRTSTQSASGPGSLSPARTMAPGSRIPALSEPCRAKTGDAVKATSAVPPRTTNHRRVLIRPSFFGLGPKRETALARSSRAPRWPALSSKLRETRCCVT